LLDSTIEAKLSNRSSVHRSVMTHHPSSIPAVQLR
jgi:hypothetical protein